MKNKKKNRISYSLSAELKNALKYLLIWGMILIFSAYLLSDSEILGNVKQQARPDTWSMIGAGGSFEEEFTCKTNRLSGVELFLSTESASVAGTFQVTLYQNEREIQSWKALVTKVNYFYLGGKKLGPKLQLRKVAVARLAHAADLQGGWCIRKAHIIQHE